MLIPCAAPEMVFADKRSTMAFLFFIKYFYATKLNCFKGFEDLILSFISSTCILMSNNQALLIKASKYCAYRERCQHEVRVKLKELGASNTAAEEIIAELILNGFINEERFSRMFAGGKFRQKKWGKRKITKELEVRKISRNCILLGLEEIDQEMYLETLRSIVIKKSKELKAKEVANVTKQVAEFCIRKGYEPGEVWPLLRCNKNDTK